MIDPNRIAAGVARSWLPRAPARCGRSASDRSPLAGLQNVPPSSATGLRRVGLEQDRSTGAKSCNISALPLRAGILVW